MILGLPTSGTSGKEPACQHRTYETWVQSLGQEEPLEQEVETYSGILAWKIPWTEKPGGQSMGLKEQDTPECTYTHPQPPDDSNA